MFARFVGPLVLGVCLGCEPAATGIAPAAPVKVPAAPDTTGLTLLFPTELGPVAMARATNDAYRAALGTAGYRIVSDPRVHYDAEIVLRVAVSGSEIGLPAGSSGRAVDASERVHLAVSVVCENRVIDTVHADFFVKNGQVGPDDVVPAANAMGRSPKLVAFGGKVRQSHEARAEESARTASVRSP